MFESLEWFLLLACPFSSLDSVSRDFSVPCWGSCNLSSLFSLAGAQDWASGQKGSNELKSGSALKTVS